MQLVGLYIGRVEQRVDPQRQGRVRVRVVGIHADDIEVPKLPWAYPKSTGGAWDKGGMFIVPPLSSYVWVEFQNGDHEYPVWSGGWWKNDKETEAADGKTRSEHRMLPTSWFGGDKGVGLLQMEQFPEVEEKDQPNNFGFSSPNNKRWELDDRYHRERVTLMDQLDNGFYVNSEHGVATLETGRGLRNGDSSYTQHGITFSSNTEDKLQGVQLYTYKGWKITIDDTGGYCDISAKIGHKIRINTSVGGNKDESIELWTANGDRLILDQTDKSVVMSTAGGRKIVLKDAVGFQVSAPEGHVSCNSGGMEVFSKGGLQIKAAGDVNISSGGRLTLDGKSGIFLNEDAPTIPATGPNYDVVNTLEDMDVGRSLPDNPDAYKRAWDYSYYSKLDKV